VLMLTIAFVGIAVISYAVVVKLPIIHATIPYTFTSGATISSSQVNANFTALTQQLPGVEWANISQTSIDVRTSTVNLAAITLNAPSAGYVVVRFDGVANASSGDNLILAASNISQTWGSNDGNVGFEGDGNHHPFSHTRVYAVSAGNNYFYAVAQNYVETSGTGLASIYGTLTATFYPNRY